MKKTISVGAYGWRHKHWRNSFYPDDMPLDEQDEDWLLTYYSNEFDTVLVPASYWCSAEKIDCESWLDDVHENFRFVVECHPCIFDCMPVSVWLEDLKKLKPQLSGLIVLDDAAWMSNSQPGGLLDSSDITIWGAGSKNVWRQNNHEPSSIAYIEDELSDMRLARSIVEEFIGSGDDESQAIMIINHPDLMASNLAKLRSVLEVMGY